MIDRRLLAGTGLAGTALTALLAAVGQVDPDPQLSHVSLTVSDFAVHDRGGATDAAMVVFGLSAWCLLPALRQTAPRVLLALFGAAMTVAALAPTDLGPLSTTGYVHRYASMLAFVALPLAAVTLRPVSRAVRWTAATAAGFAALMLASATLADRFLIGAAERYLLLAEVVLLALLAVRARRDCPARPVRSTVSHA
ncbi:DUF998 domain-containing protein [Catellatospora coxensis]|uniref:DUF998 domain-containing protein n=1 Tax=Catellatospora coxensis TaxID=310354 RepID=A0A8J3P9Q4_9ACTN|nr:DUF998 domain-containing protein [Catellatospora coxensis]GIG09481.1 hypothetical protein Cco03nite_61810 [Catellatospora coxensis]